MTNKSILVLVVSSSGSLQNGLLALMTTIPPISAVLVAEDINSALRMIENHQPALIILDISSFKVQDVIKEIKTQWPHIHLIVLAEDITQQIEAEASGVDSALLKGFSVQKFIAIIENLIDQREGSSPVQTNTEGGTNAD
jgi:DNA-binding NarL/FixJ family response regulator